ncbi:hypothetical protein [Streptomyces sp. 8L]|uniref:hypothetical protein n=1 Tax=Streptomyces sp. 8L TaxID=2877242 RepID=UPI001CD3DAE9|nr:hypothetical protein [Streptomyces sp. 8L]MCA1223965.1 hypothetical protein [Streptomyces sp. 8L]
MPLSAAHTLPADDGPGGADVIPFDRTSRTPRVPRQDRTDSDPQAGGDGLDGRDAQGRMAEAVQQMFLAHGRTLTDPDTAEVFILTLDIVASLHAGAAHEGVIDDDAHTILAGWIDGLRTEGHRAAPDGLSQSQ